MIKGTMLDFSWTIIASLAIMFTIVKLIVIRVAKVDKELFRVYFSTLHYASIYEIERVEGHKRKRFLRVSNWINILFYTTALGVVFLYVLFRFFI